MRFSAIAAFVLCKLICVVLCQECKQSEYAIFGMMLRGHTYKKLNVSIPFECLPACNDDFRCHSFNYVISQRVCELSNRSKEARPENFISNSERYYFRPSKERGKLRCEHERNGLIITKMTNKQIPYLLD